MPRSLAAALATALTSLLLLAAAPPAAAGDAEQSAHNATEAWLAAFKGRAFPVAAPADACQVCFYEEPNYGGAAFCVGQRDAACTEAAPIAAPSSIGSIRFFTAADGCELVANVRVTVPPYGQRVDLVAADVPATGYDAVVQELFVEPAGRACLLADAGESHYGRCYSASVTAVESRYRRQFHEVLLFRGAADFYVVAYEHEGFNGRTSAAQTPASTSGLSKRFSSSSDDLTVPSDGDELQTLDGKISSVEYVPCAEA